MPTEGQLSWLPFLVAAVVWGVAGAVGGWLGLRKGEG